ncbi:MAG TPA: Zn-dependent hydrolase [Gammaproteobacteria bacterium]|jgi:N-carbamoyl-L-amino-acid hydrolase|nr:allantoate amidohydrolase [Gammaproteobacteria bacterium]PHS06316.1 MAG: Zn-dependent hydrolase [Acidithiobacillus sp.]RTZ63166.1 MAG: Zn-dependent hydrolase [Gammaproteobacteria bacterium]HAD35690.1 Zn-dependent hydrolase [Gammaproteobacteria bacterium]HHZ73059.1 Zn-dependent hydrolase [Gammaproteobacteria bacterium]|tara:strand:+ start:453 stop:1700 length:1248 start_codon:yes stop_codon:yes gene_type:complete
MNNLTFRSTDLSADVGRLQNRIKELGRIGAITGGGVCRLSLSDEDRDGRDLVVRWMHDLGLVIQIDGIGNVIGTRTGILDSPPVIIGSHIDSVATGGLYDGALGVLAGLEAIQTLNDADLKTQYPIAVGFFTNEEGVRFTPDMMGSAVHQGSLSLETALETVGTDGQTVGAELSRIGYAGDIPVNNMIPRAFLELHIEQGPVLENTNTTIGAVTGVQGISWTEFELRGVSNHAGTTPMHLRHDAGYVAAAIAVEARAIATDLGANQVATVGVSELTPNLINVIANRARVIVDLRNSSDTKLTLAETRLIDFATDTVAAEGVTLEKRSLARFSPVEFDTMIIDMVEKAAAASDYTYCRLPSGAGHDAQMFAPNCPTGMIFIPSKHGISHNINEFSSEQDIAAGMDVLMKVLLELSG